MRPTPTPRGLPTGAVALLLAIALPLAADGQAQTCNLTTSQSAAVGHPVAGDEAFFKLPTGSANVMIIQDTSGSMTDFAQCGDSSWPSGDAYCSIPAITAPPAPAYTSSAPKSLSVAVNGTCTPASAPGTGVTAQPELAWMESVPLSTQYADPGRPYTAGDLMWDTPAWGNGGNGTPPCSGNNCLFDPTAYYIPQNWGITSARRYAFDTPPSGSPPACTAFQGTTPLKDANGAYVNLGPACTACMTSKGFFLYNVAYVKSYRTNKSGTITGWNTASSGKQGLFKGTFLNGNPPKFVIARKAVKDLLWIDPLNPSQLDNVRFGFTIFDGGYQGVLMSPLVPTRSLSYPIVLANFQNARQPIVQMINATPTSYDPAAGSTPVGQTLFDVGQYFTDQPTFAALSGGAYGNSPMFDAPAASSETCSVCWACQKNSVVIVTDGSPNEDDSNFPSAIIDPNSFSSGIFTGWDDADYYLPTAGTNTPWPPPQNSKRNCGPNGQDCIDLWGVPSTMPRVAAWFAQNNLWPSLTSSASPVNLFTSTIGFNITKQAPLDILNATANMGQGDFSNVATPTDVRNALFQAVTNAVARQNSFSAPAVSGLATNQSSANGAFVSRFLPNATATWEGHLFQGSLFDEFLQGCDPTKPPSQQPMVTCGTATVSADLNGATDAFGNAVCSGVFLVDQDCTPVGENQTSGGFFKLDAAGNVTTTPANFPWDAGAVLSGAAPGGTGNPAYRSADENASNKRLIYTAVNGALVELTAANAAILLPYLNVDPTWCADPSTGLLHQIGVPITGVAATDQLECAKQIIWFVRGWDVLDMDKDRCAGPDNPLNTAACPSGLLGEQRDRPNDNRTPPLFYKLGDIFHSSPITVTAPADEFRCDLGYENQCLATIHGPQSLPQQTPLQSYPSGTTTIDAYEQYRQDNVKRQEVVLAGANDGMMHAFLGGNPTTLDPTFGTYNYDTGTGAELWAFVPPDLLPRLRSLLAAHQYMVDGTAMVRDVWVDGTGGGGKDGVKQRGEFHTIAVITERSGGTQYTALDVTDPASPPVFLWSFPQACSDDSKYMGESWSDFAPRPPPIGPVKLAVPVGGANDPTKRGFEERWVVMVNGGYDPTLGRGRAIYMVDAWTGQTLWRYTADDFASQFGYGPSSSMYPVPGAVAMLDIGDPSAATFDADGFFDTATWGDLGGDVFLARLHDPGVVGSNGLVGNWFVGRAFEEQRTAGNAQNIAGRSPFFYMTSNTYEGTTRTLRTYLGSGDRENLMTTGPTCTADDLLGCCQAGCSVSAVAAENYGACSADGTFACDTAGNLTRPPGTGTLCASGGAATYSQTGATPLAQDTVLVNCGAAAGTAAGCAADGTCTWGGSLTCDALATCTPIAPLGPRNLSVPNPAQTLTRSRFYGFWSYGANRTFNTAAGAAAFDQSRFTDVPYVGCSGISGTSCALIDTTGAAVTYTGTTNPVTTTTCTGGTTPCSATAQDPGWFYEYGRVCPLASCTPPPPWYDEKTGAAATIVLGCTTWSGFLPIGSSGGTDPCTGSVGTPVTYSYVADYVAGTPNATCGYAVAGVVSRAAATSSFAPPSTSSVRVAIGPSGTASYSTLQMTPGAAPTSRSAGSRTELSEPVYLIEVPRQLHDCRHVNPADCDN